MQCILQIIEKLDARSNEFLISPLSSCSMRSIGGRLDIPDTKWRPKYGSDHGPKQTAIHKIKGAFPVSAARCAAWKETFLVNDPHCSLLSMMRIIMYEKERCEPWNANRQSRWNYRLSPFGLGSMVETIKPSYSNRLFTQ